MSEIKKDKQFTRNEDFMQTIYSKVASLRQNLDQYQIAHQPIYQQNEPHENIFHKSKGYQNNNFQQKIHLIKLNQQSKLHRQNIIQKERIVKNMNKKIQSTSLYFSSIPEKKHFQSEKISSSLKKRTMSSVNISSNTAFQRSNQLRKSQQKKYLNKKYFSSKQLPSFQQNDFKKQNTNKLKNINMQKNKTRSQHKMFRLAGFLDHYDNRSNINKVKFIEQNQVQMNEFQDMTDSQINKQKQFKFLDSDQKIDDNHIVECLKEQKFQLQENNQFKPIGSARTTGRKLRSNCTHESHDENLLAYYPNNQQEKSIIVGQSKMSNYSKDKSLKKKFLQKGNRFRDTLYKKLLKNSINKNPQMIYVRQYDQWVPMELLQNNKSQLQTYMKLLLGQKKQQKSKKLTLNNVDLLYY